MLPWKRWLARNELRSMWVPESASRPVVWSGVRRGSIRHVFTYEPSRSRRGVAWVSVIADRDLPTDEVRATALEALDDECRRQHDFGLPSLDPSDYSFSHRANDLPVETEDPSVTMVATHWIKPR